MKSDSIDFNLIVNNLNDVVSILDKDFNRIYTTPSVEKLLGYSPEEIKSIDHSEIVHPDDFEKLGVIYTEAISNGISELKIECRVKHKNGNYIWIEDSSKILYKEKKLELIIATARDATQRHMNQDALISKDKLLVALSQSNAELVSGKDLVSVLNKAFKLMGEAFAVDRLYYFENYFLDDSRGFSNQIVEWVKPGIEPQIDNPELQNIPFSRLGSFYKPLLKNESVYGLVANFEPALRQFFEEQGILSIIVIPIFKKHQFAGFIGMDNCTYTHKWTDLEYTIFESFAYSLKQAVSRISETLELELAKEQAEKALKSKEDFFSTVSHEIRTPLQTIVGLTEVLKNTSEYNNEELLEELGSSGKHLLHLANDFLDFTKIQGGSLKLENIRFNLKELIENTFKIHKNKAREKSLDFSLAFDKHLAKEFLGDPMRLGQIINNLLSNAVKFTSVGKVSLSVKLNRIDKAKVYIDFTVKDTGLGIPESNLDIIFSPFDQGDSSIARKYGGTGLGLTIVKNLATLLGGSIKVNSIEGQYSQFSVSLPLTMVGSNIHTEIEDTTNTSKMDLRLLCIDDHITNHLIVKEMLKKKGVTCEYISSWDEIVDVTHFDYFDLILLDMHMPNTSGLEVSKKIISHKDFIISTTPITAFTADNSREMIENLKNCDIGYFLLKPLQIESLMDLLTKVSNKGKQFKVKLDLSIYSNLKADQQEYIQTLSLIKKDLKDFGNSLLNPSSPQNIIDSIHKIKPILAHLKFKALSDLISEYNNTLESGKLNDDKVIKKMIVSYLRSGVKFIANEMDHYTQKSYMK